MDSKMKEMPVTDMLGQTAQKKRPYVAPKWEAIAVEHTHLICTSIQVGIGSTESEYEDKGEREGDDYEVDLGF